MEGLSIISQENYVNEDINVVFTPNSSVTKYEYYIYRNNEIVELSNIDDNNKIDIILK